MALAAGDPLLVEKAHAEADYNRLVRLRSAHDRAQSRPPLHVGSTAYTERSAVAD
jgi:hypothetical protein